MKSKNLLLFLLLMISMCSPHKPLAYGEESRESVIQRGTKAMFDNQPAEITKMLINRTEFRESVFPHFPESAQMTADEFWESFIVKRRDSRIGDMIGKFRGNSCKVIRIGAPKKIAQLKKIKLHYQTPFEFECIGAADKKVWRESETNLFGTIVESNGKFRWLSAFWD